MSEIYIIIASHSRKAVSGGARKRYNDADAKQKPDGNGRRQPQSQRI